jgi:hypothetical protein
MYGLGMTNSGSSPPPSGRKAIDPSARSRASTPPSCMVNRQTASAGARASTICSFTPSGVTW